ncbi:hypothetical protein MAE30S32_39990 [Microcystis aeruginosa 11-30S32]|uniref:Uncharacterized protein n=1 Tax=Microcystis aeruginosa 11-30S32 TaxID=2358142 RepID=A0A510PND5_MICAE|nr:hypothetical protein MAE30S32_39990 [Microcystis aeruginosa 11-30S32]
MGGDTGNVGTVIVFITGISIIISKVVLIDNLVSNTIIISICTE